jgi:hypothetical protein
MPWLVEGWKFYEPNGRGAQQAYACWLLKDAIYFSMELGLESLTGRDGS